MIFGLDWWVFLLVAVAAAMLLMNFYRLFMAWRGREIARRQIKELDTKIENVKQELLKEEKEINKELKQAMDKQLGQDK